MKKDIDTYELIEKYLKNELQGQVKSDFENRLSSDENFALEVRQHEEMFHVIIDHSLLDIKNQIQNIHRNNGRPSGKNWLGRNLIYFTAGGILLISVSLLYLKFHSPADERQDTSKIIETGKDNTGIPQKGQDLYKTDTTEEKIQNQNLPASSNISSEKDYTDPVSGIDAKEEPIHHETSLATVNIDPIDTEIPENIVNLPENISTGLDDEDDKIFDCSNTEISAIIETEKTCEDKATGKIMINEDLIEGGTSPYMVSIDGGNTYQNTFIFSKLRAASYTIYLKDIHDCNSKIGSYWIASEPCITYPDAFAPDRGEVWKIPNQNSRGVLRIYNTSGKLVNEIVIEHEGEHIWDGRSGSGSILPMGIYSFVLELENAEDITGNVTILR